MYWVLNRPFGQFGRTFFYTWFIHRGKFYFAWFEEISVYYIWHCSSGAYLTAVIVHHVTAFMLCTWRPMQNTVEISSKLTKEILPIHLNQLLKCLPEWDRATPLKKKKVRFSCMIDNLMKCHNKRETWGGTTLTIYWTKCTKFGGKFFCPCVKCVNGRHHSVN